MEYRWTTSIVTHVEEVEEDDQWMRKFMTHAEAKEKEVEEDHW